MYVLARGVPHEGPASNPPTQTVPLAQPPPASPASALPEPHAVDGGAQVPVSWMHTDGDAQKAGRHGPSSSMAASSKVQSEADAGVATLPVASSTLERSFPLSPGSMMRNATTGRPFTTSNLL